MNLKIYWIKFKTAIEVFLTRFVYNFNKIVPGVRGKRNIKYIANGNKYNKLDIFYPTAKSEKKYPVIVYFHGGGWAAYSKYCYSTVCKRLAKMGYVVFNCNYSLTPRYNMSRIVSDSVSAILFAHKNAEKFGGDGNRLCLAGDSAGAHIASLITGVATSEAGNYWFGEENKKLFEKIIKANLLFYGAFDLNSLSFTGFPDIETYMNALCPMNREDAPMYFKKYSSTTYVTKNYPPSFIASGQIDHLHESQSKVMYDMLLENGVKCDKVFFESDEFRAMHAYIVVDGLKTTEITFNCVEAFLSENFNK